MTVYNTLSIIIFKIVGFELRTKDTRTKEMVTFLYLQECHSSTLLHSSLLIRDHIDWCFSELEKCHPCQPVLYHIDEQIPTIERNYEGK